MDDGECEEVSVEELEREDEHALHEARIAMMAQWEKSVRTMHVRNCRNTEIIATGEEEKVMTHKEQVLAMQRMEERAVERHIHEMWRHGQAAQAGRARHALAGATRE